MHGRLVAGKYRLITLLGSGGMAEVWSATNQFTDREVAIKFMSPRLGRERDAAARFLKEAKVAARVDHPNVVDVIDVGQTEEGELFIVMERLTGFSLEDAIRRHAPPLRWTELTGVMIGVGEALAAAHRAGIIHRDLKPSNVLLHRVGSGRSMRSGPGATTVIAGHGRFAPKLLDFGVSKLVGEEEPHALTLAGTVIGSPLYMSPEQARGDAALDGRTDIFAFGGILFEALAGCRPYEAKSFNALIVKIATMPPRSIDEVAPAAPEALRRVVRACLETDRTRRPPRFEAVVAMLRDALIELEPASYEAAPPTPGSASLLPVVLASVPPPAEPSRRRSGERATLAAGALALVLAGIGLGAFAGPARLRPTVSAPASPAPAAPICECARQRRDDAEPRGIRVDDLPASPTPPR